MNFLTEFEQMMGKTIKCVNSGSDTDRDELCEFALEFVDGSIAFFSCEASYDVGTVSLDGDPSDRTLREFGWITQEEYDSREKQEKQVRIDLHEAHERERYEQLKAKFEKAKNHETQ